jgi:channel protein (hemolysin III family)
MPATLGIGVLRSRVTPLLSHFSNVGTIPGFCQPVSSLTHLVAAVVAVAAAVPLVRLGRGSPSRMISVGVYAFCVVVTLFISGVYHSLDRECSARAVMKRADYFAIWLLIAGTFTAVHGVMCRGFWRAGLLTIIWTYATIGISLQVVWFRTFSGVPGLLLYLGLGWIGVASVVKLSGQIGFRAVRPVLYAGLFFSAGAILEATRHPIIVQNWIGPHEIFHLAVIAGVAIHWMFVRALLMKHAPAQPPAPSTALARTDRGVPAAGAAPA